MPRLIVTQGARDGLERCRRFLAHKNNLAARKAAQSIKVAFERIALHPESGRLFDAEQSLRELLIPFGEIGYVALYR